MNGYLRIVYGVKGGKEEEKGKFSSVTFAVPKRYPRKVSLSERESIISVMLWFCPLYPGGFYSETHGEITEFTLCSQENALFSSLRATFF